MKTEDWIFWFGATQALGAAIFILIAAYGGVRSMSLAFQRSQGGAAPSIPKWSYVLFAIGLLLFPSSLYFMHESGKVPGPPGPQGERGPAGPPGQTSTLDQTEIKQIKSDITNLKLLVKLQDCQSSLSILDQRLKQLSVEAEVEASTPPNLPYLGHRGLFDNFPSVIKEIKDKILVCSSGVATFTMIEPSDDQMDTPVSGEPKGDIDASRRFRRVFYNNAQAKTAIETAKQAFVGEESQLRTKIAN